MKTIDLLVQELPALGGWPDGAVEAGFLCSDDTLFFVNKDGDCPSGWRINMNHEVEDNGIEVTREQYEAALAAKNDGWIEWGGGECPVEEGTLVDVRYRNGEENHHVGAGLSFCDTGSNPDLNAEDWSKDDTSSDIIAYRLHQPQEVTEADDESDLNECIGQDAAQVWGGEGKPAIGEKCEHHSGGQWEAVTIAGIYENLVTGFTDYWMVEGDGSSYTVGNPYRFRPIRSEADKKRDEAIGEMIKIATMYTTKSLGLDLAFNSIYNSIAAGEIPGVKLED